MNYSISVVVPVLNEEDYLEGFLDSLLQQDYPREQTEILFADGGSRDGTVSAIREKLENQPVRYRILRNEGRTAPCAMNLCIAEARGEIIVRLDAHRTYPPDYISKCVHYLTTTDADNVGCPFVLRGQGTVGECIEKVLTSAFGVGASDFRKGNELYSEKNSTEYVDTVPLGTFLKETAVRLGGFDERYPRAEDNDFNYRIRKMGGKVLLFKDIHTVCYCRRSVRELVRMGYGNGESVGMVFWKAPGTVSLRHLIPFLFLLSLIISCAASGASAVFSTILKAELLVYGLACAAAAVFARVSVRKTLMMIPMFPALHLSYGLGTAAGLAKGLVNKVRGHDRH